MGATTCFGLLFVMFCEPSGPPAPPPPDTYCQIAKPIRFSAKATRLTKEQVDTHNRQWVALCRNPAPAKP